MKLEAFADTFNAAHQEHFGKPASRSALELAYGHFVGASLCVRDGNPTPTDFAANGNELVFAVR